MEPSLKASEMDQLIKGEEKNFDGWLERLIRNGVSDTEAASAIAASTARHQSLTAIRRGYLTKY